MDLRTAIYRAVKFCPRGKNAPATLQAVRFVPAYGDFPSMIYSTAGYTGVLIKVEEKIPNALIPVDGLRKMIKASKTVDMVEEKTPGTYRFTVTARGTGDPLVYNMDGGDVASFPSYPGIPLDARFNFVGQWGEVEKVLFAVGKEAHKPDYMTVHFTRDHVLATNGNLIAQADIRLGYEGLVPADVFNGWPKGAVESAWTNDYVFFRIDDELRFAALQRGVERHEKASKHVVASTPSSVVVETKLLRETVKRALDVSEWRMVAFDFSESRLTLRAFQRNREKDADAFFTAELKYQTEPPYQVNHELLIDGKAVVAAVKQIMTPNVRLKFGGPKDSLKLEAGWLRISLEPHPWG